MTQNETVRETVNVVIDDGTAVYASDSLEKCQTVASKLRAASNSDVTVWNEVVCDIETETDHE